MDKLFTIISITCRQKTFHADVLRGHIVKSQRSSPFVHSWDVLSWILNKTNICQTDTLRGLIHIHIMLDVSMNLNHCRC